MDKENLHILMNGLIIITFIIMIILLMGWITTPTEFTLNINISHIADNNTKALYDALNRTITT